MKKNRHDENDDEVVKKSPNFQRRKRNAFG